MSTRDPEQNTVELEKGRTLRIPRPHRQQETDFTIHHAEGVQQAYPLKQRHNGHCTHLNRQRYVTDPAKL